MRSPDGSGVSDPRASRIDGRRLRRPSAIGPGHALAWTVGLVGGAGGARGPTPQVVVEGLRFRGCVRDPGGHPRYGGIP